MISTLPNLYEDWLKKARKTISNCLEKYRSIASEHRDPNTACLPAISFLLKNGNVTTYEYIYGEAPLQIDEPILIKDDNSVEIDTGNICLDLDDLDLEVDSKNEQIDWGDIVVEENSSNEIDWGAIDDISTQIVIEETGTGM